MWIREISPVEMDLLGADKASTSETRSFDLEQLVRGTGPIQGLSAQDLRSPVLTSALRDASKRGLILARFTPEQTKLITSNPELILDDDLIPPAKDSEEGIKKAMSDIKRIRTKIQMLDVALKFLKNMGRIEAGKLRDAADRKKGKVDKKAVAKAAADVAGAVAWKAAVTVFPILAIVKGAKERVIEKTMEVMKKSYNNDCGGEAGETVGDFSKVGKAGRLDGKCAAADGEPEWINEGFRPYLWRTALSFSKWTYSPIGISKNKMEIKEILDERKKRGRKAPPEFKRGGKNMDMQPPSACRY
jgi:hypothetical protein